MLDECDQKKFPEWQAHYYFMQLIDGLEYLHSRGIIHKDIKPANLLLTIDQVLKITDLGVSEELDQFAKDDTITTSQGSPVSQSPEIAAGDDSFSGYKVDIWSCGVTLYRMCTTQYPFDGETICKLYDNIAKAEYTVPDHLSDKAKVLIKGMLAKSANDRLTIADIRRTEWFRQQKPMEDDNVLMPTTADNRAFAMTMFPNLKALIMTANGQSPAYESDNEVVLGATECYNVSDGEPVPTDSYDVNVNNSVRPGNEASHSAAQPTSRKKQKKCSIS
ncbi:STK11 [Bugula neritina]|uniref:non-specific serine/threonine protein kinase n=1 Tax=Bugula neritina TaxID=10212 RepID=A0A7J7J0A4_BUGNE|nr:STK11 [Bugula neritina]